MAVEVLIKDTINNVHMIKAITKEFVVVVDSFMGLIQLSSMIVLPVPHMSIHLHNMMLLLLINYVLTLLKH